MPSPDPSQVVCVDVGSTFTKASLIDLDGGRLLSRAEHRTTIEGDVLDGVDACLVDLGVGSHVGSHAGSGAVAVPVLACSSAGGGLRIAVVGNEELVTAEAGRRVALSSGGKVVAVVAAANSLGVSLADLAEPDVVLLTGGTDGGNTEVVVRAARELVAAGWRGPVVVAGNVEAQADVGVALGDLPHVITDNVVPRIGVLCPGGARAAIREMFLAHVIGGKHLSSRDDGAAFLAMVRGATPDVVLTGVEVLARAAGDVVVVDVGGATTDVHSVVDLDPEEGALARDVVAPTAVTRTVEGDLGMRWSALGTAEAAERHDLRAAARRRTEDPAFLPATDADRDDDEALAGAATGVALRRHAGRSRVVVSPEGRVVERTGIDLRAVELVLLSGGALRHGRAGVAGRVLAGSVGVGIDGGWQLPETPRVVVDADYVLAAVGLLAADHPTAARRLARTLLVET